MNNVLGEIVLILHEFIVGKTLVLRPVVIIPLDVFLASLPVDDFLEFTALRSLRHESSITALFAIFVFVLFDEIHYLRERSTTTVLVSVDESKISLFPFHERKPAEAIGRHGSH